MQQGQDRKAVPVHFVTLAGGPSSRTSSLAIKRHSCFPVWESQLPPALPWQLWENALKVIFHLPSLFWKRLYISILVLLHHVPCFLLFLFFLFQNVSEKE